jgi:hypothetical protein
MRIVERDAVFARSQHLSVTVCIHISARVHALKCVGVKVCGCVGVWVCGCVGVWVCGCVGVWVCGCVGVCSRADATDEPMLL